MPCGIHLAEPERHQLYLRRGVRLQGLHCAIAGKSVAAFFSQNSDYTIRFTNITPRNIHNTPDAYESEALAQFAEHPGDPDREMYYGFAEYQANRCSATCRP